MLTKFQLIAELSANAFLIFDLFCPYGLFKITHNVLALGEGGDFHPKC